MYTECCQPVQIFVCGRTQSKKKRLKICYSGREWGEIKESSQILAPPPRTWYMYLLQSEQQSQCQSCNCKLDPSQVSTLATSVLTLPVTIVFAFEP